VLAEEGRDGSSYDAVAIDPNNAEQPTASLAIRYWTPKGRPTAWVKHAYPQ
jgi:hypothetical protein